MLYTSPTTLTLYHQIGDRLDVLLLVFAIFLVLPVVQLFCLPYWKDNSVNAVTLVKVMWMNQDSTSFSKREISKLLETTYSKPMAEEILRLYKTESTKWRVAKTSLCSKYSPSVMHFKTSYSVRKAVRNTLAGIVDLTYNDH